MKTLLTLSLLVLISSCTPQQEPADSQQGPSLVEFQELADQWSTYYASKDSVALADMYASDGMLNAIKGREELIATFGKMMRASDRTIKFTVSAVTTDGEYVVDIGSFQSLDSSKTVTSAAKYLVVWKQENGGWKIYRDWGL